MGLTKKQEMRLKIGKSRELLEKQKRLKKEREKIKQKSDPRPKQGDIDRGVYKNYNEYRKAVQAWRKRNPEVNTKWFQKNNQKSNKPYAKDRVGKVDLNSKEYKEAKRINERPVESTKKRLSKEERAKHIEIAKNEKLKIRKDEANKKGKKKAEGATTTGGPVKSGVEYARSKGDDLAGYRRTKDTRITKKLKKAGFTEDRLARLRKEHAEWKAKRKKKKK